MYRKPKFTLFLLFFVVNFMANGQTDLLRELMESKPEYFGEILKNQSKYEVQILYTQIDRDKKNRPYFTSFAYEVDANQYFYPASTVKLPASILALEKINQLKIKGLTKESAMITGTNYEKQTEVISDSTADNGKPSIAHYIKKILMVSDNDAYNRLYEFLGQKDFNEAMWKKGFLNSRFVHRLEVGMNAEQNKHTNPIRFYNGQSIVYQQDSKYNLENYFPKEGIKKGVGYIDADDKLVNEGFDFTKKNKFALADQHLFLQRLLFPKAFPKKDRFKLTDSDYQFVYKYMSQLPTESTFPKYSQPDYWPTYCKFALFGSDPKVNWPKNIRVFNKVGDAYGFLLDNAYIVDYEAGVEFLLSVVILCNSDQIFNDGKYDYDAVGFPFMKNLGRTIYDFEKNRPKKYKPNLESMKLLYDK
jgi:Beta-lactamase enzyme family